MKKILKGEKSRNGNYYSQYYDRYFEVDINGKKVTILESKYHGYHCETFVFVKKFNLKKLREHRDIDIQPVFKSGKYSIRTVSSNLETTIKILEKVDKLFGIEKDDIEGLEFMATETYDTGYKSVG